VDDFSQDELNKLLGPPLSQDELNSLFAGAPSPEELAQLLDSLWPDQEG